jgi:hypothetical protein
LNYDKFLDDLYKGKLQIEYTLHKLNGEFQLKATVKSCNSKTKKIDDNVQLATCGKGVTSNGSNRFYRGWDIPTTFRCIDSGISSPSKPREVNTAMLAMILTAVGCFLLFGIIAAACYYCDII